MNPRKNIVISFGIVCFMFPVAVFAVDEEPSFTNPAQAQHAENLAEASFSDDDWADAEDRAKTAYAEDQAEALIEEKALAYADEVYRQKAEEYAEDFVVQKSLEYADSVVDAENRATNYAESKADSGTPEWDEAYQYAMDQLRSSIEWKEANSYAYDRATGDGYRNLKITTAEDWMADPDNMLLKREAYNNAINRAYGDFGPGHQNAYQTAVQRFYGAGLPPEEYEKYMTEKVSEITGERIEEIRVLRYEQKMGWGQIKKMYPTAPKGVLGLGHSYKENIKIQNQEMARSTQRTLSLDDEIAEVTKRNTRTGWTEEPDVTSRGNKANKNTKKYYGLSETSGVTDDIEANQSSNRGKGRGSTDTVSSTSSNKGKNKNSGGFDADTEAGKSNNGKNGSKSEKNNNGNKGGNNTNSNNGNKGGNGKNK